MDTNSKLSFFQLLKSVNIRIPNLQRAYAQGRNTKKAVEIRNNFIVDIRDALLERKELSLDTVYGELSEKTSTFVPLDGQQRLTTLFLLHLYLACYLQKNTVGFLKDENGKSRFTYATRVASDDFCNYLVKKDFHIGSGFDQKTVIPAQWDKDGNEIEGLTQRIIKSDMEFQWTWYNDPTIASMLNMLDTIHKIFFPYENEFTSFYNSLTEESNITFWYQEITGAIPADELYIRMNARGLALTEFENFKASLFHFLLDNDDNTKELQTDVNKIKEKIDSDWQNAFWKFCKTESLSSSIAYQVDNRILRVLHICILFQIMAKYINRTPNADGEEVFEKLVKNFREKKLFNHYDLFQNSFFNNMSTAEKQTLSKEIFRLMELVVARLTKEQLDNTDKLLVELFNDQKGSFERILYFYVQYYMFQEVNEENRNSYRILKRLIKYTYITEFKDFESTLAALFKLKSYGQKFIVEFLKCNKPTEFLHNGFAINQSWEEYFKLQLKQDDDWQECIEEAENNEFFNGQILFLFECLLDEDISAKNADDKIEAFQSIVEHKNDDEVKEKFSAFFEIFRETYKEHRDYLRKGLILQSLAEMDSDQKLPDYPFTSEYAKEWRKENARSLNNNPGSMIIDSEAADKLSWKRVLRIDLTNQHNDKPVYRQMIKRVLSKVLQSDGDCYDAKWKTFINNILMEPKTEWSDPVTVNVCTTLLKWCQHDSWEDYYRHGIRLYENGQLYLLKGDAARISKDYQELHMMLLLPAIRKDYDVKCGDYGCLIVNDIISLEYCDGCVRGWRGQPEMIDRNPDYEKCVYDIDSVVLLIDKLQKNVCEVSVNENESHP